LELQESSGYLQLFKGEATGVVIGMCVKYLGLEVGVDFYPNPLYIIAYIYIYAGIYISGVDPFSTPSRT
jgi:hypothetical protein